MANHCTKTKNAKAVVDCKSPKGCSKKSCECRSVKVPQNVCRHSCSSRTQIPSCSPDCSKPVCAVEISKPCCPLDKCLDVRKSVCLLDLPPCCPPSLCRERRDLCRSESHLEPLISVSSDVYENNDCRRPCDGDLSSEGKRVRSKVSKKVKKYHNKDSGSSQERSSTSTVEEKVSTASIQETTARPPSAAEDDPCVCTPCPEPTATEVDLPVTVPELEAEPTVPEEDTMDPQESQQLSIDSTDEYCDAPDCLAKSAQSRRQKDATDPNSDESICPARLTENPEELDPTDPYCKASSCPRKLKKAQLVQGRPPTSASLGAPPSALPGAPSSVSPSDTVSGLGVDNGYHFLFADAATSVSSVAIHEYKSLYPSSEGMAERSQGDELLVNGEDETGGSKGWLCMRKKKSSEMSTNKYK